MFPFSDEGLALMIADLVFNDNCHGSGPVYPAAIAWSTVRHGDVTARRGEWRQRQPCTLSVYLGKGWVLTRVGFCGGGGGWMCVRMRWCFISRIAYVYCYEGKTWAHRRKLFDRPYYNKTLKYTKSKSIFAVSHSKLLNQANTEDLEYLYVRFEKVSKFKTFSIITFLRALSSRKVCLGFIYKCLFKTRTFYVTYTVMVIQILFSLKVSIVRPAESLPPFSFREYCT